jgi:hypothetical protein
VREVLDDALSVRSNHASSGRGLRIVVGNEPTPETQECSVDGPYPRDPESLSADLARAVDAVCHRFETAWRDGRGPCIEDHLVEVPEPARPVLLAELIAVERELRAARGEQPTAAEYGVDPTVSSSAAI